MDTNECLSRCPISQFVARNKRREAQCAKCHPSCATCRSDGPHDCLGCSGERSLLDGRCYDTCPEHFYSTNGRCEPCVFECSSCTGPAQEHCLRCRAPLQLVGHRCQDPGNVRCSSNQYLVAAQARCAPCHPSCAICDGGQPTDCLTCASGLFLHATRCLLTCPAKYFGANGKCARCAKTCATCNGTGGSACTSCLSGFQLRKDGSCGTRCPLG